MLMFAVLARERRRLFSLLLLTFLLCAVTAHGSPASAASLNVKIRQLNPNGTVQQVTCVPKTKCLLPIDIQTGSTKESVTVHVLYVPGNVLFEFETPKGFFYAGDTTPADKQNVVYEPRWHGVKPQTTPTTTNVTLFLPLVPHVEVAPILNAVKQRVADVEIITEQGP
jgi:hypothetical protein